MGRKSIDLENRNKIVSVSILPQQKEWLDNHKDFDTSKFFQLSLEQIINTFDEFHSLSSKKEEVKK